MRRRSVAPMLAALCLLAVAPAGAERRDLELEGLAMQWPEGYTILWHRNSTVLIRGDGQKVVVSSFGPVSEAEAPMVPEAAYRKLVEFGANRLELAGVRFGAVLVPLARADLPDGSILLSHASEKPGSTPRSYLIQFNVIGRAGRIAYITVEGTGAVVPEYQRLLPLFQTARWIRKQPHDDRAPEYDACARPSSSFS